jgi:DNA polymerase I
VTRCLKGVTYFDAVSSVIATIRTVSKIRRALIARAGHKLVSADYSQIESRLLAHIAGIPQLKAAFAEGQDIHAMTASEMFGVPVEGMPADVRRRAKAINFGIIYGISAFGLRPRQSAGHFARGCRRLHQKIFRALSGHSRLYGSNEASRAGKGYVTTIFGRKCHYPRVTASNPSERAFNERVAINAPIQGSAADIIRRAMIRLDEALEQAKLSAKMLLQVHDELVFEVPDAEVEATIEVVRKVMAEAPHRCQGRAKLGRGALSGDESALVCRSITAMVRSCGCSSNVAISASKCHRVDAG